MAYYRDVIFPLRGFAELIVLVKVKLVILVIREDPVEKYMAIKFLLIIYLLYFSAENTTCKVRKMLKLYKLLGTLTPGPPLGPELLTNVQPDFQVCFADGQSHPCVSYPSMYTYLFHISCTVLF